MNPRLIIIGTFVLVVGIFGAIYYRRLNEFMFEKKARGNFFTSGPPEFLLLSLFGTIGMGLFFILGGIFGG